MVEEWGIVISINRAKSYQTLRQSHWWLCEYAHEIKKMETFSNKAESLGIKLHGTKKGADVLEQLYNQQQLSLEQLINLL